MVKLKIVCNQCIENLQIAFIKTNVEKQAVAGFELEEEGGGVFLDLNIFSFVLGFWCKAARK